MYVCFIIRILKLSFIEFFYEQAYSGRFIKSQHHHCLIFKIFTDFFAYGFVAATGTKGFLYVYRKLMTEKCIFSNDGTISNVTIFNLVSSPVLIQYGSHIFVSFN